MENDDVFTSVVQQYKNVVTHYLQSKVEIWMGLFMKPFYNVDGGFLVNEFAKSRGAIHCHSLLTCSDQIQTQKIQSTKHF